MVAMVEAKARRRIFHLFAELLEYPQIGLSQSVRECEALISPRNPEAAALVHAFRSFVEEASLGQVQELYTRTFDLDATYHPYVGHHLFGESYKRSAFMVGLKERYQAYDLVVEGELPDHLGVMLRFLSLCDDAGQTADIVQEAISPALERMVKKGTEDEEAAPDEALVDFDPKLRLYPKVLEALQLVLQELPTNGHHLVKDLGR
jgi:nitrate reductase delta subunit